ncbi:MAG: hypothetical protein GDA43_16055 [Hormoscilla sp. SP5CHS1]|nr:hypothetical protein [Hormoscilla sp. SP5CHS1]
MRKLKIIRKVNSLAFEDERAIAPSFSQQAIAHCCTTVPDCGTAIARVSEDARNPVTSAKPSTRLSQLI